MARFFSSTLPHAGDRHLRDIPYGPTNLNAYDHIPDDVAKNLPSYPENLKLQFARDYRWETQINEDTGKTNLETLIDRWNRWIFS